MSIIPRWLRPHISDISSAPAEVFYKVTKADADLPLGPCRGLLVGTAGNANLMRYDGTIVTDFPLQQGFNPIGVLQVRTGGTATVADNIWALM